LAITILSDPLTAQTLSGNLRLRVLAKAITDASYASVERDNPELLGKPVPWRVCAPGFAAAASYEARKFAVWSAVSSSRGFVFLRSRQFNCPVIGQDGASHNNSAPVSMVEALNASDNVDTCRLAGQTSTGSGFQI
jgi:nucleotidyltransferase/DNA polymerase involved in DNA repair